MCFSQLREPGEVWEPRHDRQQVPPSPFIQQRAGRRSLSPVTRWKLEMEKNPWRLLPTPGPGSHWPLATVQQLCPGYLGWLWGRYNPVFQSLGKEMGFPMLIHMASGKYRNNNSNPGLLDSKDQKGSISLRSACVLALPGRRGQVILNWQCYQMDEQSQTHR